MEQKALSGDIIQDPKILKECGLVASHPYAYLDDFLFQSKGLSKNF